MIDIEQFLMSLGRHKDADGKLNPIYLADTLQEEIKIIQEAVKHSQRWVSLTDEERLTALKFIDPKTARLPQGFKQFAESVEQLLKEKNT